jgi:hypothetical protein
MTRHGLLAVATGGLLAAWLTYPTIVHPGSMARVDTNDGRFSLWNVAWVAHAVLTDPVHLFDANIFHPHTGTLAYSEANLVAGAMATPVYGLTGNPIAAHNVVVYVAFVLSFVTMWALVRRLTGDALVGLISGTAYAFAPFVAARTPHVQLLMVFVFPVVMLAFHRFTDRPGVRRGAVLGLSLAMAALACGYYGIFAGLAVALGAVWFAFGRLSLVRYAIGLLAALVVAAVVVLPALLPYLELREGTGTRSRVNVDELRSYSADARAYLTSPARAHQWLIATFGQGREVLFPGFVVTLAAFGAFAYRRAVRTGPGRGPAVGRDFRLRNAPADSPKPSAEAVSPASPVGPGESAVIGPEEAAASVWADVRDTAVNPPGPTVAFYAALAVLAFWASFGPDGGLYMWLSDLLPFMSFLRAPARLGIVVVLALAVLAGFGLAALLPAKRKGIVVAALTLATAAEISAAPWPLRPVPPVPEAYRMLAELPRGPVVQFHFPYQPTDLHQHARYMFWSMWHWQPLVNGYSDYIPRDFREIMVPINGFPDAASFRILRERRVRYVTIDWDTYGPEAREILLARFPPFRGYLRPLLERDDVSLYEVVDYPGEATDVR